MWEKEKRKKGKKRRKREEKGKKRSSYFVSLFNIGCNVMFCKKKSEEKRRISKNFKGGKIFLGGDNIYL